MSSSSHAYDVDDESSPSPSPIVKDNLSLICYNMRGPHPDTDRLMLRSLLLSTSADIIILQEPTWVPKHFITFLDIEQTPTERKTSDTYQYVGQKKEVGILYKHQTLQFICEIPLRDKFNNTFIPTNTYCGRFQHISDKYEILVVSYHSPVVGIDDDDRMDAINAMLKAIVNISQSFTPPLPLIGGADTNLDLYRARMGLLDKLTIQSNFPDDLILHSQYTATARRTPPVIRRPGRPHLGKIDYFFHYPTNLGLNMTKVMDVNEHSTLVQNLFNTSVDIKKISNHDPLMATMTNNITTCFQNEKPHDEEEEEEEEEEEDESEEEEEEDEDEDESDEEEDEEQESEESDEDESDEEEDEDSDYDSINIDNSNSDSDCDSDNDNTDIDDEYEYTYYHDGRVVDSDGVDSDGECHY